jgi:regulator of replication initiation timing
MELEELQVKYGELVNENNRLKSEKKELEENIDKIKEELKNKKDKYVDDYDFLGGMENDY